MLGSLLLVQALLPGLGPVAHRIEAVLAAAAGQSASVAGALSSLALYAWLAAKTVVLPIVLLTLFLLVELRISESERERKNYLLTGAVQIAFLFLFGLLYQLLTQWISLSRTALFVPSAAGAQGLFATHPILLVLLNVVAFDIFYYWTHRLHHSVPALWRFHAVHHKATDLDVTQNIIHPVELCVRYFTISLPLAFIVQGDETIGYAISVIFIMQNHLTHMNIPINVGPLGRVLVDNRYHFLHHSRDPRDRDRNFAVLLPLTDMIFGTYKAPARDGLAVTGIDGVAARRRLRDYLVGPSIDPEAARPDSAGGR